MRLPTTTLSHAAAAGADPFATALGWALATPAEFHRALRQGPLPRSWAIALIDAVAAERDRLDVYGIRGGPGIPSAR